jgi:hypothetical protein
LSEKIRGGGHVGSHAWLGFHAGWPMATLSVEPDSVTLSMWPVTYRFERSSIQRLLTKQLRLGKERMSRPSLLIVHTNPAFPKSIIFQPREFSILASSLTENGFLLTEEEGNLPATEPIRYSGVIPATAYTAGILALIAAIIAAIMAIGVVTGFIGRK